MPSSPRPTAGRRSDRFTAGAPRVLVVEDSETIREMVGEALTDAGYHADLRPDGDGLEDALEGLRPDLVVLDVMLPGRDGFALVDVIREWCDVGIVMITARDALQDRVRGLDGGADDYVVKPFELAELVSRVGAVLRRRGRLPQALQVGDLVVDAKAGVAARAGTASWSLTSTELRLLHFLIEQRGRIVSANQILERGLGLRRVRPEPGAGPRQRAAAQARSARPAHPAHRPRHRVSTAALSVDHDPGRYLFFSATPTPSLRRPGPRPSLLGLARGPAAGAGGGHRRQPLRAQARRDLNDRLIAATSRADALPPWPTPLRTRWPPSSAAAPCGRSWSRPTAPPTATRRSTRTAREVRSSRRSGRPPPPLGPAPAGSTLSRPAFPSPPPPGLTLAPPPDEILPPPCAPRRDGHRGGAPRCRAAAA